MDFQSILEKIKAALISFGVGSDHISDNSIDGESASGKNIM